MKRIALLLVLMAGILLAVTVTYTAAAPDMIIIGSLAKVYGPVEFSHSQHAEIAGDCAKCHHHSPKGNTPRCGRCHEAITVYRYDPKRKGPDLGLKGAYHGQCMGCHREMESGPLGCTDCHQKKE